MSATVDLIAHMVQALQDYNAGKVSANMGEYHVIVCTDRAYGVMNEAYKEWAAEEVVRMVRKMVEENEDKQT